MKYKRENFDAEAYYRNTYGVSVLTDRQLITVELKIDRQNAPYVLTKPFHHSQQLLERDHSGSILITGLLIKAGGFVKSPVALQYTTIMSWSD